MLSGNVPVKTAKKTGKQVEGGGETRDIYADNRHPELIGPLIEWRTEQYMTQNVAAYCILTQKTLLGIADTFPKSKEELLCVPGFGPGKWSKYGPQILELLDLYRK